MGEKDISLFGAHWCPDCRRSKQFLGEHQIPYNCIDIPMLSRSRPHHPGAREVADGPPIPMLLDVDREYRERAAARDLPTIAPRRFNPSGEAWLPVLHTSRDGWHFTALFSNTAQAHQLGRTHDWVVVYFYDDEHAEGQHTVVTETHGALTGQRVVRGRETECRAHYSKEQASRP